MFERFLEILGDLGLWSYFIIFMAVFLESAAFLGFVVPGETAVVISGILASQEYLKLADCLWINCLGAILGDTVGYSVGRFFGIWYFRRHKRFLFITQKHIRKSEEYFRAHGGKTVFLGRFVSFMRAFAPFTAGMSKMHYGSFAVYNVAGGIVWAVAFTLGGYFFGASWHVVEKWFGRAGLFGVFVLLVAGGFYYLYHSLIKNEGRLYQWAAQKYGAVTSSPFLVRFFERHPRVVSFVWDRLSPRGYLGVHLTVGFVLSVIFIWLFGGITQDVFSGDPLVQVDQWVTAHVVYFNTPGVSELINTFSILSGVPVIAGGSLIALLVFARKRRADYTWGLLAAVVGGGVLTLILKLIIHTVKPPEMPLPLKSEGWAFPSGYASLAIIFYGIVTYFLIREPMAWRLRAFLATFALFIVTAIGFCRIFLQFSYLSDILSGYVGGLFWLTICITGFEIYQRKKALQAPRWEA